MTCLQENSNTKSDSEQLVKLNPKSTSTKAQYSRILEMLRGGSKSTFDFRRAGVMNPSMRINELNKKGEVRIDRVALENLYDSEGFMHPRIALYALIEDAKETNHEG